jgi:hypothetical protein
MSAFPKAAQVWQAKRVWLCALPWRNQHQQLPADLHQLFNAFRLRVESVNAQLANQFHIEVNPAHTFWGLCARLYTKLAADTLCIYLKRLLGRPQFLQIKSLAFPISYKTRVVIVAIKFLLFPHAYRTLNTGH